MNARYDRRVAQLPHQQEVCGQVSWLTAWVCQVEELDYEIWIKLSRCHRCLGLNTGKRLNIIYFVFTVTKIQCPENKLHTVLFTHTCLAWLCLSSFKVSQQRIVWLSVRVPYIHIKCFVTFPTQMYFRQPLKKPLSDYLVESPGLGLFCPNAANHQH